MGKLNKNFPAASSVTQVQGSNDWSIVSKYSTVVMGYYEDNYLQYFVSKPTRRSPLIHRGYYARFVAMNSAIQSFLKAFSSQPTQIISYGAGFDSTFFRLHASGALSLCTYIEIDFREVVERKRKIIATTPELQACISSSYATKKPNYILMDADLRNLQSLEQRFKEGQISPELPTLIFSECAITYMDESSSSRLIQWTAEWFQKAVFINYEQVYGNDNFGIVMTKHFQTLSSPLLSLPFYPTSEDQKKRYLNKGWEHCNVLGIHQVYEKLSPLDKQRISALEPFDEHEPLACKCNHYVLITAYKNIPPFQDLLPDPGKFSSQEIVSWNLSEVALQRWGHASAKYQGKTLITGGFGLKTASQLHHARLDDLIELQWSKNESKITVVVENSVLSRMYHTMTNLRCQDKEVLLIFGGRQSPLRPLNDLVLIDPSSQPILHVYADNNPPPRWRHAASVFQEEEEQCLVVTGGKTNETVLADCWIFRPESKKWQMGAMLPFPRHSHAAVTWRNQVVIAGGLSASEAITDDVLLLEKDQWRQLLLQPKPLPRFSHQACLVQDTMLLLGGVTTFPHLEPGLSVINLTHLTCQEYRLTVPDPSRPLLLQAFTVDYDEDLQCLRTIGGGANCFSFGTHMNNGSLSFHWPDYFR